MHDMSESDRSRSDESPVDQTTFCVTGDVVGAVRGQEMIVLPEVGCHIPLNFPTSAVLPSPTQAESESPAAATVLSILKLERM
jgi:hypothetical protein